MGPSSSERDLEFKLEAIMIELDWISRLFSCRERLFYKFL
jgi:hypothetical protein